MAALSGDLKYAIRMLRKSPGFTTVATLTLAIAIGANSAIFSFVDGVLLKPLPYDEPDRIVRVMEKPPQGERQLLRHADAGRGSADGRPLEPARRVLQDRQPVLLLDARHQMVKGRALSERDTRNAPPAMVVSERLAKRFFSDSDPIGQRILIQEIVPGKTELGSDISWEVVGVIRDEKIGGPVDTQSAGVYVSNEQSAAYGMVLNVRTSVAPLSLQKAIVAAIRGVSNDQAISDIRTVEQIRAEAMSSRRLQSVLLGVFGGVALVLAGLGVYGVISYSVAQRTRELGIRALDRGMLLTLLGLGLGVGGAIALTRLMATLLYGVGPRDPATMVAVGVVLGAVATMASYVPSRRATKVDPIVALRYE